jgi:hypothetical protein
MFCNDFQVFSCFFQVFQTRVLNVLFVLFCKYAVSVASKCFKSRSDVIHEK